MSLLASSSRSVTRTQTPALYVARASTSAGPSRRRRRTEDLPIEGVDLVAPPDPVSNIRPVIYASPPTRKRTPNSPYSTGEFPSSSESRLEEMELEWRLRRERVDAMNHRFWATNNASFDAQLAYRLSLLPPPSVPPTPEDERRKEECVAQFYADWQAANRARMTKWVRDWWGEVWAGLMMQGRIYIARALRR